MTENKTSNWAALVDRVIAATDAAEAAVAEAGPQQWVERTVVMSGDPRDDPRLGRPMSVREQIMRAKADEILGSDYEWAVVTTFGGDPILVITGQR